MTFTDGTPPTAPLPQLGAAWDRCDHCRAPLDERQRYCVGCGARRPASEDPVARWFAADRRARLSAATAPPADGHRGGRGGASGVTTALLIALLPLAAAAGVFVGRGANGNGDSELLVAALRAQKPPVVNIVGGSGGGAAATSDDSSGSSADAAAKKSKDKAARSARDGGRVIAHTRYGDARQLTGARISRKTRDESRRALEKIANSKGRAYVESQRGLPDQIVIP